MFVAFVVDAPYNAEIAVILYKNSKHFVEDSSSPVFLSNNALGQV